MIIILLKESERNAIKGGIRMKRKMLALLLSLTTVVSLAACGSGEKAPEEKEEEKKIVYWTTWNEAEPQGQVIKEAAAAYEEETGVKVEINWQGRDIVKVIASKLESGEEIDMFDGSVNTILPATIDYAADLSEYYEKDYATTDGKPFKEVILQAIQDSTKTYSNEGEINGVPYQPFIQCMFYNKDHFKEAGITELPKDWESFLEVCDKLKAAGYAPLTTDDAYMLSLPGCYLQRAKGSEWVSKLVTTNDDEMWKDPAVLEMAKAYEDMAKKGYFHENITSNVFPAGQQDIANGNVSMYLNASWVINELMPTTGPEFPWGEMQFPAVPNGEGAYNAANYASQVMVANKESDNIDEVFDFMVYLTTGEWDSKLAESTYGVPAGIDSEWPVQLEDAKEIFDTLEEWTPWSGGIEDNGDLTASIKTLFTNLIGGKITAEEFVEGAVGL